MEYEYKDRNSEQENSVDDNAGWLSKLCHWLQVLKIPLFSRIIDFEGTNRTRKALNKAVFQSLAPVSLALAAIVLVFIPFEFIEYRSQNSAMWIVISLDFIMVFLYSAIWSFVRYKKIPSNCANVTSFVLAVLTLTDTLLSMHLLHEAYYSVFVMIIPMGAAAVMLSLSWLVLLIIVTGISWGLVANAMMPGSSFVQFAFAIAISSTVSLIFQAIRIRIYITLENLRQKEKKEKEKVAKAYASAEREIIERKKAEKERALIEAKMLQAQKQECLGVLAGGVAHDFNNILMAIIGNAELLLAKMGLGDEEKQMIETIRKSAQRGSELSMQMLHYSGKGHFLMQAVDLERLVEQTALLMDASATKKANLVFDISKNVHKIEGDVSQLRQLIVNLVLNASEALDEHEGKIKISVYSRQLDENDFSRFVYHEGREPGRYTCLEITDTGHGMTDDVKEKLFDPFFSTKFPGRGLGLAAVLGIVRGHKGAIEVESVVGKGSTFRVYLPSINTGKDFRQKTQDEKTAEEKIEFNANGKVLIVDDEAIVRQVAGRMFKKLGMEVIEASTGRDAIEIVCNRGQKLDLVVLDMSMTDLSGTEVLQVMKAERPDLPVILSSGYSQGLVESNSRKAKPDAFLQKPYVSKEMKRILFSFGLGKYIDRSDPDDREQDSYQPL
ncbi:MAG: response regulator [Deltaproteobacteria bacterium]|nr:response regulator [Deltaproteobacteria bacterium]